MTKEDVLDFFVANDEEQAKRHVYKYTDCGAWIDFHEQGIMLGSIVEGSDIEIGPVCLVYKDSCLDDIQSVIDWIEESAEAEWLVANDPNYEDTGEPAHWAYGGWD